MPRKRKSKPSGVVTVLVIVGAALLLIGVGNWLKGTPQRRVSPDAVGAAASPAGDAGEIPDEDRRQLENLLQQRKRP